MNRYFADRVLPIITLMAFEIAALAGIVQAFIFVRSGAWLSVTLGDILERVGFGAPPADWMNGSIYDTIWNEPLWLTSVAVGLVAATYAAIGRYESSEAEPSFVYP